MAALESRPELVSAGRLAGRLVSRALAAAAARVQDAPLRRALLAHLGPQAATWPVLTASWPAFDQVNVQLGVEAWLASPGRAHELLGVTGTRYWQSGLADLLSDGPPDPLLGSPGVGSVTTEPRPAGPGGATHPCVGCGVYLIEDRGERFALLLRGPEDGSPDEPVRLQVAAASQARAGQLLDEVRRLAAEHNVYRGQVISFDAEDCTSAGRRPAFLARPRVGRADVVLPRDVLDGIERQVVGISRHATALRASGQHLKRGVLLHGPPGTGKTHTVRYLLSQLPGVTVIAISGKALGRIAEACSVARTLQPAVIVVEDVDLIAEERTARPGEHPLLFQLLNEMEGLNSAADVTFLLTTNRADLLEPALAARPGRVDLAAELPLPDAAARRALLRLYQGELILDDTALDGVIERTEGVTAPFLRELLRKAALLAAEAEADSPDGEQEAAAPDAVLRVSAAQLTAALDQLLSSRGQLTRVLLGGQRE